MDCATLHVYHLKSRKLFYDNHKTVSAFMGHTGLVGLALGIICQSVGKAKRSWTIQKVITCKIMLNLFYFPYRLITTNEGRRQKGTANRIHLAQVTLKDAESHQQ